MDLAQDNEQWELTQGFVSIFTHGSYVKARATLKLHTSSRCANVFEFGITLRMNRIFNSQIETQQRNISFVLYSVSTVNVPI